MIDDAVAGGVADLAAAERFCEQMALACTTSDDEIHTILALAEIAEKQGRWADAAAGLTGAIKHHGAVKIGLPAVLVVEAEKIQTLSRSITGAGTPATASPRA